jgi:hypothetical protein
MRTATIAGDQRQKRGQDRLVPESFTHGTSQPRAGSSVPSIGTSRVLRTLAAWQMNQGEILRRRGDFNPASRTI